MFLQEWGILEKGVNTTCFLGIVMVKYAEIRGSSLRGNPLSVLVITAKSPGTVHIDRLTD